MSSKNLASIAAAGDGMVKTADLNDKERLRVKLEALLASAATNDIHRDLLTQSVWAWKVDRRTRVISHDYGIPITYAELQKMVTDKRLKGRKDVDHTEAGYLKYLTHGEYTLEDKDWAAFRNPQSAKDEGKMTTSSEFFEKTSSRKKSDSEYYREAARMARNILLACLSTNEDAIVIIRNGVELGTFHSLDNFLERVAKDDGTVADDGSRTILKTVQSFKRLARLNTSKLELNEIAVAYYDEFVANLTAKEKNGAEKVTAKNVYGEECEGATEEPETFMLSRCAVAMALMTVDEDVIKQIEHEFRSKTSKNSTPTAFRDNLDLYMQITKRELNKAPKQQKVRAISEQSQPTNDETAKIEVARVQSSGQGRGRGRGRGRGGRGRGGGSGGSDRSGEVAERSGRGETSEKRFPCPFCWHIKKTLRYNHMPNSCDVRDEAEKSMKGSQKKEPKKTENVKTVSFGDNDVYENYNCFENGRLGLSHE